jgi:hypothetical protein
MNRIFTIFYILTFIFISCNNGQNNEAAGTDGWLEGDQQEKFNTVAKHLRGFDMAMVETGYRYTELFWAGKDENWEYADYQLEKIRTAIENGLERRPKRAASAKPFLETILPQMKDAIQGKDTIMFLKHFTLLQSGCKSCHIKENVSFFQTEIPKVRLSPIKFNNNGE